MEINEQEVEYQSMHFPETFKEFLDEHSFIDREEVYTNKSELIQTFRVEQGYEHFEKIIRLDEKTKTIDEIINILNDSFPLVDNEDIVFGFKCAVERLEQLKGGAENENI